MQYGIITLSKGYISAKIAFILGCELLRTICHQLCVWGGDTSCNKTGPYLDLGDAYT